MATKTRKSYEEYLDDLGNALMDRGEFEATLAQLIRTKKDLRKQAKRAKWFSEERYNKWAEYFACKADIVHMQKMIRHNDRKIEAIENCIARFGIPPEKTGDEPEHVEAEQASPPHSNPTITFFNESDFQDQDEDQN